MELQIDDTLSIEVYFDPINREDGFMDDIRIWLSDAGPADARLFPSDAIGLLLTADQAEQIAAALAQAAQASRATPR